MKMQGSYSFEAPLDVVWNALFDPEVLARTLPGCEKLEREGNQFKGDINVKMGPVQGKFQGKVDIVDIKERESYTMIVDGRGPAGFGKATAMLRVQPEGAGTRLDYDSDVTVGGKIASVGQRLIDASSRAIVKQSLEGLHQQIKALATQSPPPVAAPPAGAAPALPDPVRVAGAPLPTEMPAGSAPPLASGTATAPAPPPTDGAGPLDPAWFGRASGKPAGVPRDTRPAPVTKPPAAPSQASFVFGVAKEVAKEVLPLRTVLLVIALLVLAWAIFSGLTGGSRAP
jgi:carbon monoxide dehydrogenase subunit G